MDNTSSMEIQEYTEDCIDVSVFDAPRTPDSSYNNTFPGNEDADKEPPAVPPHLNQTLLNASVQGSGSLPCPQNCILNHLYIRSVENTRSVIALGLTHRFRSKFVTVVLYKPVRRRSV